MDAACYCVRDAHSFCILRSGATEAGFFPGIGLTLTNLFATGRRGQIMAPLVSASLECCPG